MDRKNKEILLKEAMRLEMNMSDLYLFYSESFPEDKDFWKQMAKEERGHAALLELSGEFNDKFPEELIYDNLEAMKEANEDIKNTIRRYKAKRPSKDKAYRYACALENRAYELHYQKLVTGESSSETVKRFKALNAADKNHAARIGRLIGKTERGGRRGSGSCS